MICFPCMRQLATITSKRQLTIPVAIFEKLAFEKGERVLVSEEKNRIVIHPARILVEELAGTISLPKRFKDLSIAKIIQKAKKEYFDHRR